MLRSLARASSLALIAAAAAACGDTRTPVELPPGGGTFPKITRFEADKTMVKHGEVVRFTYSAQDADTVEINPDVLPATAVLEGSVDSPPIERSTNFTLIAKSGAGQTMRTVAITVGTSSSVQIVRFTATPTITAPGGSVTLSWSVERSVSVSLAIEGGAVLDAMAPATGTRVVMPADTTTYVLSADGPGGPISERLKVNVGKLPAIASFRATPDRIMPGESSRLSWDVSGAATIEIVGPGGAQVVMSEDARGDVEVRPQATSEYLLVARNATGAAMDRVTVTVAAAGDPMIDSFTANPMMLSRPGMVTLDWRTTNATSTMLFRGVAAVRNFPGGANGSFMIQVDATTTFRLVAANATAMGDATLTVTVAPPQDTTPPVITHTPVTAAQPAGAAVGISASVTDDTAVASVRVFYRAPGAMTFQSAALTGGANGAYSGSIPAAAVTPPGVEYYLEAADTATTANVARSPSGAPAQVHAFSVAAPDTTPPVITHTAIASGQLAGAAITVNATIVDAGSGVNSATLFWRAQGSQAFQMIAMTAGANGTYSAVLPGVSVTPPGIEYYLSARDGAMPPNSATLPVMAPGMPFSFTVTAADTAPPAITHTPIANGQTAGGAITISADVLDPSGVGTVTLYYRRSGTATFTSAPMTATGNTYRATIPAGTVATPGVDYYLEARDLVMPSANVGRSPASAPGTPYSFTVIMNDTVAPMIVHTPVAGPRLPNQAVMVSADVTDASGVAQVQLFYRTSGGAGFTSVAMTGGPTYTASIPANVVVSPGVDYYISARDSAASPNTGTSPATAPGMFHSFAVGVAETESNDTPATADVLLSGGALTAVGLGGITPAADLDFWSFEVPAGGRYNVRIEVTSGGATSCPSPIDPDVRLYATDGTTVLVADAFDGVESCPLITPQADSAARALAPGRYYVRVEESGNNATIASYELRIVLTPTGCGNGILEAPVNEQCDDGNTGNGDGCSATCLHEPEGVASGMGAALPGDINPAGDTDLYAVDITAGQAIRAEITNGAGGCPGNLLLDLLDRDGVSVLGNDDDDGIGQCPLIDPAVDLFASNLGAGRYFLRVRASTPADVVSGYTLAVAIRSGICGNAQVELGEECDDGNSMSLDGCSSMCRFELEGTAMGMGGSFMAALTPAGNKDWFRVIVAQGEAIRAETFAPASPMCAGGADTVIRFWASNRTTQIATDDQGGVNGCSLLDPATSAAMRNLAAGTYFISVEDYGNNSELAAYTLDVQILRPGCGNGYIDASDQCDDGNMTPGDGCSATCTFEGAAEVEPNGTSGNATPIVTAGQTEGTRLGTLSASSDVDMYSVVVPAGWHVFASVAPAAVGDCAVDNLDLRLYGPNGTQMLAMDTGSGVGLCGEINPGRYAGARALAAGTYYVQVEGAARSSPYRLTVRVVTPGCGDTVLDAGESCDDGNRNAGDGCSATCAIEGTAEAEPNGTAMTATPLITSTTGAQNATIRGVLGTLADVDLYRIVVPSGYMVLAEVSDGRGGCSNNAQVRLRGTDGSTLLVSDTTDGPSDCGRISPGADTAARNLPAGAYYLEVSLPATETAPRTAVYTLSVRTLAPNVCGNVYLDTGEQCDDGNAASGDGCSATCQLETQEMEPNNTRMTATAVGTSRTVGAMISPAGDEDWYAVVVPQGGGISVNTSLGARDQCGTSADTIVDIVRADGTTLASDDDDGPSTCSQVDREEARGLAAGTYYVRVHPYSGTATFSYVMTLDVQ